MYAALIGPFVKRVLKNLFTQVPNRTVRRRPSIGVILQTLLKELFFTTAP